MVLTPCVLWEGKPGSDGYGKVKVNGRTWRAHRWVWTCEHGPIPKGMCVLHRCDIPMCVNLDHLFLGTPADNNRDRATKGRSAHFPHRDQINERGEHNGNAKLSDADVVAIRVALNQSQPRDGTATRLARCYGVSKALITRIKNQEIH